MDKLRQAAIKAPAAATSSTIEAASSGTTRRVSLTNRGGQVNGQSFLTGIAGHGEAVTFTSTAGNLGPRVSGGFDQIYLRDLRRRTTSIVSVLPSGRVEPLSSFSSAISRDARCVLFEADVAEDTPPELYGDAGCYLRDRKTRTVTRVAVARNGGAASSECNLVSGPISADGRFVLPGSAATDLVSGDTNAARDLFIRDTKLGRTTRVSVGQGGGQANSASFDGYISGSGRYVAFLSYASSLVPEDANGQEDAFLLDRGTGAVELLSVATDGTQANASTDSVAVSDDGRYVAFSSDADDLVPGDTNGKNVGGTDIFLRDRQVGTTTRIDLGPAGQQTTKSFSTCVSGIGENTGNVFVYDRRTRKVQLANVSAMGQPGNSIGHLDSLNGMIAADDREIGFSSNGTNLVPHDTNKTTDAFIHALDTPAVGASAQGGAATP